jgi:hypothetical protein
LAAPEFWKGHIQIRNSALIISGDITKVTALWTNSIPLAPLTDEILYTNSSPTAEQRTDLTISTKGKSEFLNLLIYISSR